jgi:5,10-methylenetetrahydromethanopterin reductase
MTLRSGVVLQGAYPPGEFRSMVERVDALGFSNLWLTDSSLHARNSYAYLTLAAMTSPRLLLGTAVTNPLTRHPAITAAAAATVDEISEGRMILGIGAGDRPLLALGMAPARLASVRAAVGAVRALWSGAEVTIEDPAFELHDAHLRFGARPDIPVYISASGPKTLELAGEIADGVILLVGLFPEALEWAIDHVDRGAATAGRPRPHVAVFAYGAIDDDAAAALASARLIAAWFPQTAPVICELAGLPSSLIEEAGEATHLLPDEFVRMVALAGDAKQARGRLEAVAAAGADSVHVFPLGPRRMQTIEAFSECFGEMSERAAG